MNKSESQVKRLLLRRDITVGRWGGVRGGNADRVILVGYGRDALRLSGVEVGEIERRE